MALPESPFEIGPDMTGDGSVTLVLAGELDLSTEGTLSAQLNGIRASRPRQLIFDLSRVSFADLGTLRALVTANRGGDELPPVLCHPPPVVVRLLEVSGLAEHCVIMR